MKHPEEHKKEIYLRGVQGIILVLGGLNWHLVCWDEGTSRERIMTSTLNSIEEIHEGLVLSLCWWLELVLSVLLALDVLGWRTSKERNNAEKVCSLQVKWYR